MKTQLTLVVLHDDIGEIWIKDNKVIAFVHCNDGEFRGEYYNFLLKVGNIGLKEITYRVEDKNSKLVHKAWGDSEKMIKLLEKLKVI